MTERNSDCSIDSLKEWYACSGNKLEYSAILISRIENGKIVEEKGEADLLGLMQQLGMELKPKEGEK